MKKRIILVLFAATIAAACGSPKVVAMQPSDPVVPQMPSPPKADNPDRIAEGKTLFEQNCAKCHKLFSPTDFTQTEWMPILERMQRKAKLDNDQMALVSQYVFSLAAK